MAPGIYSSSVSTGVDLLTGYKSIGVFTVYASVIKRTGATSTTSAVFICTLGTSATSHRPRKSIYGTITTEAAETSSGMLEEQFFSIRQVYCSSCFRSDALPINNRTSDGYIA